jgi:hypothetical protein
MEGQRRAARGVAGSFNEQPTESGPVTRPQEDDHGSQEEDGVAQVGEPEESRQAGS